MPEEAAARPRRAQVEGQGALHESGRGSSTVGLVAKLPNLLKVRDAARLLGLGKSAVYQLIRMRRIRSVQIPGRRRSVYRIPADAIAEFIVRHTRDVRR